MEARSKGPAPPDRASLPDGSAECGSWCDGVVDVLLGAGLLVAAFVLYSSDGVTCPRYVMVDELVAGGMAADVGKQLQVHGFVEPGTIVDRVIEGEVHRTFRLYHAGKRLRVFLTGPTPDFFRDDSEVIAEGRLVEASKLADLAADLHVPLESDLEVGFDATDVLGKCPGKYDGVDDIRAPVRAGY
jgi:cytochrome c-type biogenesis protein CcmE